MPGGRSVIMGAVQNYYFHLHLILQASKLPEGRDPIFSRSPTLCWAESSVGALPACVRTCRCFKMKAPSIPPGATSPPMSL